MNWLERLRGLAADYWAVISITAVLLAFSFYLQVWSEWSPMTLPEEGWQKKLDLHLNWAPFAVRYFQSYSTLLLHHMVGLPIRESFFTVQFTLALLLGPMLFRYLRQLRLEPAWSLVGVGLFLTAYPMLGAHYAPTHTWDDFWSYLFVILAFLAALRNRPIAGGLYFTLGLFAREQIILLYPLLVLLFYRSRREITPAKLTLGLFVLPVVYGLFRLVTWEPIDPTRWKLLAFNFADPGRTQDTLVSLIIAFGIMWLLAPVGWFCLPRPRSKRNQHLLIWGLVTALPLTTAVTLLFTMARETRLFFPPFIIVVPLSLYALRTAFRFVRTHWSTLGWIPVVAVLPVMIKLGLYLSDLWFPEFDYGANAVFRRFVAGIHIGLALWYLAGLLAAALTIFFTRYRGSIGRSATSG